MNNVTLSDSRMRLRTAIHLAVDLAGQIERGQATMPLRDHFEDLSRGLESAPFTLALLALDVESRGSVLSWFCGEDYHVLTLDVPGAGGLVEVQLAERGYVLLKSGRRQEFDRLAPFLEAVRAADLVRQGDADAWLEPMHLELSAPRGLQGLRILIPESPAALAQSPAVLPWLRTRANLLVVAGPTDHEPDQTLIDVLHDLASDSPGNWAITRGASPSPEFFQQGWPSGLNCGPPTLPSVHLGSDLCRPPSIPAVLTEADSDLRRALFVGLQSRRFEAALDMLEERIQEDIRMQTTRRKTLTRHAAMLVEKAQDFALRETAEAARRAIAEALARQRNELEESHRKRVLPSSVSSNKIKNVLEDLSGDDVSREAFRNVVRLSVAPAAIKRAERLLRDLVRADVKADLERIGQVLDTLESDLDSKLSSLWESSSRLPLERFDHEAMIGAVDKTISLDPHYQGELHQRTGVEGVFEWAMHGRRPVFLLTMMSSMGIPFLTQLRDRIAPLMALIFLGGLWLARRSYREEQHATLERALHRIRETLGTELRRVYDQGLREWENHASRHFQKLEKNIERAIEERFRAGIAEQTSRSARDRVEVQEKLRFVDHRQRELGGLVQQAGRTRVSASEARQALERATREILHELQTSPGVS